MRNPFRIPASRLRLTLTDVALWALGSDAWRSVLAAVQGVANRIAVHDYQAFTISLANASADVVTGGVARFCLLRKL